jgi:hypothetical protein
MERKISAWWCVYLEDFGREKHQTAVLRPPTHGMRCTTESLQTLIILTCCCIFAMHFQRMYAHAQKTGVTALIKLHEQTNNIVTLITLPQC